MNRAERQYDPEDPKYTCCCGCHVMAGAWVLTAVYTAIALFELIPLVSTLRQGGTSKIELWIISGNLVAVIITVIILSILWYGLFKERERLLIPMLELTVLNFALLVMVAIVLLVLVVITLAERNRTKLIVLLASLVIVIILIVLQYLFFIILKKAYHYIKHKRMLPINGNLSIQQMENAHMIAKTPPVLSKDYFKGKFPYNQLRVV